MPDYPSLDAEVRYTVGEISSRFKGAFANHFKSWSVFWDVLCSLAAVILIARNLPYILKQSDPSSEVILYLSLTASILACLVPYRRANSLRSDCAWTDPAKEDNHIALLTAEVLCSLVVVWVLMLPPLLYVAFTAPATLAPDAMSLIVFLVNTDLILIACTAVFFLMSGYTFGTEGYSVLAWLIVILGFSRSQVGIEVTDGLSSVAFLPAEQLGGAASAFSRIFCPPIEELIKSSLAGTWQGNLLYILQALLLSAFALCLSALMVSKWGKYGRQERRELKARAATSVEDSRSA